MKQIKWFMWSNIRKEFITDSSDDYIRREDMFGSIKGEYLSFANFRNKDDYDLFLFSGLKDINGQDIFDGHIIKEFDGQSEWFYEVCFTGTKFICIHHMLDYHSWHIGPNGEEIFEEDYEEFPLEDVYFKCEVVGHMKTNSELVKP